MAGPINMSNEQRERLQRMFFTWERDYRGPSTTSREFRFAFLASREFRFAAFLAGYALAAEDAAFGCRSEQTDKAGDEWNAACVACNDRCLSLVP